jgi:hypothetical protein
MFFSSYVCGNKYGKREIFKNHLVTHFRSKLETLKPDIGQSLLCEQCDYNGKDKNAMFVHFGLKHRLMRQCLPETLNEVLFKQVPQVIYF